MHDSKDTRSMPAHATVTPDTGEVDLDAEATAESGTGIPRQTSGDPRHDLQAWAETVAGTADGDRIGAARAKAAELAGQSMTAVEWQEARDVVVKAGGMTVSDFAALCPRPSRRAAKPAEEGQEEPRALFLHPVATTNDGFFFAHGAGHGCMACDGHGKRRGVYYEPDRFMSELPHVKALVIQTSGKKRETYYLLAATSEGRGAVLAADEIELGRWSSALSMTRSADRKVKDAVASVIFTTGEKAPVADYALRPTSRTDTGHIPQPVEDCLPVGYWERPEGTDGAQLLENCRELARQVARSPKMALMDGAAVGGTFAAALGELSAVWNAYGNPRQGKTTILMAGCCNLGNPGTDSNPVAMVNLNSTKLGANQALGEVGLFAVFFNESGTADFAPEDWARFIYSATGGNIRGQSAKYGGGRNLTPGWAGTAFISGNARVADGLKGSRFSGIAARLIEIPAPLTVDAKHAEDIEQLIPRCHGYVMPKILERFTVDEARKILEEARNLLGMPEGGTPRTVAKALSTGIMGAMMKDIILGTGTLLTDAALEAAREYLAGHPGEPEREAEQIIGALRTDMAADRGAWMDEDAYRSLGKPRDGIPGMSSSDGIPLHGYNRHARGFMDAEYVYITSRPTAEERSTWESLCEATGVDASTALRQLWEDGALRVAPSVRKRGGWTSSAPRWAGKVPCYQVRLSALEVADEEDNEEGDGGGGNGGGGPQTPPPSPILPPSPAGEVDGGEALPCDQCGKPTTARVDGRPRHLGSFCGTPAPTDLQAMAARVQPRETSVQPEGVTAASSSSPKGRPAEARPDGGRTFPRLDQEKAFRARVAVLDAMDSADDSDEAVTKAATALRVMEAMTDDPDGDRTKDGPFAPVKYGALAPFWTAPLPDIAPPLVASNGWGNFEAPTDYRGPAAVLDRNAGHPSALSSLRVAHGRLEATGALSDARRPGYYKTVVHPWAHPDLPSPMDNREVGSKVWVTHERMRLLEELAKLGPEWWPDATILDSRTAERETSLRDLSQLIKHLRTYVIDTHGKDAPQWEAVKEATNAKLIPILTGTPKSTGALDRWTDRTWYTKCHRTDWGHALHDKAAMNLLRVGVKLSRAEVPILAMRHMDEIVIPAGRVADAIDRGLIKADESGRTFGTFKTKDVEEWGV